MTELFTYGSLVLALGAVASVFFDRRATLAVSVLAWLGVIGGFFAIEMGGVAHLAAALGVASMAGVATLIPTAHTEGARARAVAFGSAIPLVLSVAALLCVRDAEAVFPGGLLLYTAQWSALSAGLAALVAGAALYVASSRAVGAGLGLVVSAAAGGILLNGYGRASLPEAFYGFVLRGTEGPLQYVVPPGPGLEEGLRLAVAAPAGTYAFFAVALLIAGLLTTVLSLVEAARRFALIGWAACGAVAAGALASLQTTMAGLSVPDAQPYADYARQLVTDRQLSDQILVRAGFVGTEEVHVATADLAPEIFGFGMAAAIAVLAVVFHLGLGRRRQEVGEETVLEGFSRDYTVRGLIFAWLSWFLGTLLAVGFFGTPGTGGAGEWIALGTLLTGTGILLMGWRRDSALSRTIAVLGPGIAASLLLVAIAIAYKFGAPFSVSLSVM